MGLGARLPNCQRREDMGARSNEWTNAIPGRMNAKMARSVRGVSDKTWLTRFWKRRSDWSTPESPR